ncbi:MAG: carboxymuconolactone decarboxylase family protein [Actinomycetota bacterium]|nr:carboxymuconolactone decarboxylase family protein [Actinomycetota bacterium]
MPFIQEVSPADAIEITKREYQAAMRRAGRVWNIVSIMSQNGAAMRDSMRMYGSLLYGESPLSRAQREMIAVVTSQVNECVY